MKKGRPGDENTRLDRAQPDPNKAEQSVWTPDLAESSSGPRSAPALTTLVSEAPEAPEAPASAEGTGTADVREESLQRQVLRREREVRDQRGSAYERQRQRILREREARRKRGRLRLLIAGAVLFVCILLLTILPAFHVQRFEVTETRHQSAEALVAASGVQQGKHFLSTLNGGLAAVLGFHSADSEARIRERFPYVDTVRCYPKFPGVYRIDVRERVAIAYIRQDGKLYFLDRSGRVLDVTEERDLPGIPVILAFKLTGAEKGKDLGPEIIDKLKPLMLLTNALIQAGETTSDAASEDASEDASEAENSAAQGLLPRVESMWMEGSDRVCFRFRPGTEAGGMVVRLARPESYDESLRWLSYAVRGGALKDTGEGILDLTGKRKVFYSMDALQRMKTFGALGDAAASPSPTPLPVQEPRESGAEETDASAAEDSAENGG